MSDPVAQLLPVAAVFLLAGLVKGVIGLGLPTVAMGLLGLLMKPAEAAALLILPSLATNLWQLFQGPRFGELLRRLRGMMAAIFIGTVAASGIVAGGDSALIRAGLGAALIVYALFGITKVSLQVPQASERWAGPVVGATTGLMTGATGVFVIPAVPYLAGLGLQRDVLVQALGLSFTVSTVALGLGLGWNGALPASAMGASLGAIAPALLGMAAGAWLRHRVSPAAFRRWFFIGLGVLGGEILWRAVSNGGLL
ncbi:sulfite exporter TauE/SafE family protein [Microvirga lenta]|uniref:sulfite exporter TauE/SafE family protein n=1 Tax=Microvirga lenta TaxID=2881337 RepID=UPI001CFEF3C2|nr:sulfite exporter TauE/SafE family protein [Microvirga lenta]MCB5173702.1 sulfite exporter TauE/SafE family protein [Microvirga lenta]